MMKSRSSWHVFMSTFLYLSAAFAALSPLSEVSLGRPRLPLGTGNAASVYKLEIGGHAFALKLPHKGRRRRTDANTSIQHEIKMLAILKDELSEAEAENFLLPAPGFTKTVKIIELPTQLGIVLPYCAGGSLFEFLLTLNKFGVNVGRLQMAQIARSIARALQALQRIGVVHGHLTLRHIVLQQRWRPVLTDFSAAVRVGVDEFVTGTEGYMSPERAPSSAVDVFAFGSVLLQLFDGRVYDVDGLARLQQADALGSGFDGALIKRCWNNDPALRPTPDQLVQELDEYIRDLQGGDDRLGDVCSLPALLIVSTCVAWLSRLLWSRYR